MLLVPYILVLALQTESWTKFLVINMTRTHTLDAPILTPIREVFPLASH